jgi:hypothetical protein
MNYQPHTTADLTTFTKNKINNIKHFNVKIFPQALQRHIIEMGLGRKCTEELQHKTDFPLKN